MLPEPVGSGSEPRAVLVVTHGGRPRAVEVAAEMGLALLEAGIEVRVPASDLAELELPFEPVSAPDEDPAAGCELVVVVGGDGTMLRAVELTRAARVPLLGVNLGHVGFLAEAEPEDVGPTIEAVVRRDYVSEERQTIDVSVYRGQELVETLWALNEASVEKASRERMIEVVVEVDGRPLSRFGCDGMVCATPTGSTAYNFSAGGPVVWPSVEALLVVPLSAHALFARPLVVAPSSVVAIEMGHAHLGEGVLWCDGRRTIDLVPGDRVEVRRGQRPVRLVRLHDAPFTDRLVAKFDLPVDGWRDLGRHRDRVGESRA
ncbi:NAD kinase [Nocardioidaceae bacterium]|nr:NAD kinase [Nocardioidaceae bacterium]